MPQAQPSLQSSTQSSVPASAPAIQSTPQAQPTAQPSYPTAPQAYSQQAPAPVADPWQESYQRIAQSLNGMQPSQPQAPSWPQTQQVAPVQGFSPSAAPNYPVAPGSVMPISQPQAMPAYSPTSPAGWPSAPSAPAADGYLGSVSNESLEVLNHFGAEAPALLNRYACTVEDALLAQAQQSSQALEQLQQLSQGFSQMETVLNAALEDNQAYNLLTTNPDLLADYVNEFFGPNGPVPVETSRDRLRAEVETRETGYPAPYQRPQMEMPAPNTAQPSGAGDFWSTFNQVAQQRPDQLWRVLNQASPEMLRSKVLVSDQI